MSEYRQNPNEMEAPSERASSHSHPQHAVEGHVGRTSHDVGALVGSEMEQQLPEWLRFKNNAWETNTDPSRPPTQAGKMEQQQVRMGAPNPFTHPRGSGIENIQETGLANRTLFKDSLAAGTTVAGVSMSVSALTEAAILGLSGATTMAAAIAAAPLAGGTLGYMAGKRLGRPITGAAAGAAIGTIGTTVALETAFGGGILGAVSGTALAASALPTVATVALLYGAGVLIYRGGKWVIGSKGKK